MKSKKVGVRISEELLDELKSIKLTTGINVSDVLNTAINTFVINNTANPDSEFIKELKSKLMPEHRNVVVWLKRSH
jgi:hypothetical protein